MGRQSGSRAEEVIFKITSNYCDNVKCDKILIVIKRPFQQQCCIKVTSITASVYWFVPKQSSQRDYKKRLHLAFPSQKMTYLFTLFTNKANIRKISC